MNLGVLASHEGTTLQSLLDAFAGGHIPGWVFGRSPSGASVSSWSARAADERRLLAVRSGQVRFDAGRLGGPDATERATASARRRELALCADLRR